MERSVLDWNMTNWITVVLMVAIGMAFIGLVRAVVVANLPGASQDAA